MTVMHVFMLDVFQISSVDCWKFISFYTDYVVTISCLAAFIFLAWLAHALIGMFIGLYPAHFQYKRQYRDSVVKFSTLVIGLVYPAISLKSLSLWNCQRVGDHLYMVVDFTLLCEGNTYLAYSIVNAIFVAVFVVGWPLFLSGFLFHLRLRLADETVHARIGHVYKSYTDQYFYWYDKT